MKEIFEKAGITTIDDIKRAQQETKRKKQLKKISIKDAQKIIRDKSNEKTHYNRSVDAE
jgi:phosphopantothenate synthetase